MTTLPTHRTLARLFAVATALLLSAPASAQQAVPSGVGPAEYDVVVARNVMVPTRDGTRLATDIYRPARDGEAVPGTFPVLLSRTPYGKGGSEAEARFLASRGYVVAIQDVRGRFESEGTFYIYLNEPKDGYDALEWVAKQPWSNGDVGTFGQSYLASTQNATASLRPPHLKAMWIPVGTANYWEDGAGAGGASALLHNIAYVLALASTSPEAAASPGLQEGLLQSTEPDKLAAWYEAYPYRPNASPVEALPDYLKWSQDFVEHSSYDDYWKQDGFSFEPYFDAYPDIPIQFIGGWYDIFLRGILHSYMGMAARHKSPTRLMVGPWVHGIGTRSAGQVDFGPTAQVDMLGAMLRWFDQVLKGKDTGALSGPPVRLFMMGGGDGTRSAAGLLQEGGAWISAAAWPPPGARSEVLYLHADGTLGPNQPTETSSSTTYAFDPDHPVPTIGGKIDSGKQLTGQGPYDQRCDDEVIYGCDDDLPLSARRDVLVYQTPVLTEDVVVAGPISVALWASTSGRDTDFTAKLLDVHPPSADYPNGFDMLVADRILRGRYRNGLEKAEWMEPGEAYPITVDLLGTAIRFKKGHRIRLDVSSSNFPFFDVNPNTGERIGFETHRVVALNTIYHDRQHPSHIVLPLVPASAGGGRADRAPLHPQP